MQEQKIQQDWDDYWLAQNNDSFFSKCCTFHRKYFISFMVRNIIERYFPREGIFIECGSGSTESSSRILRYQRKFIALDISFTALQRGRAIGFADHLLCGNIFQLPLKKNSVEGIWNLGVMEHFHEREIAALLNEFYRIVKKGGYVILFWPPVFGSTQMVLNSVEAVYNKLSKSKKIQFFPNEVSVLRSREHAEHIVSQTPFRLQRTHFSPRDIYTYYTLVLKKE